MKRYATAVASHPRAWKRGSMGRGSQSACPTSHPSSAALERSARSQRVRRELSGGAPRPPPARPGARRGGAATVGQRVAARAYTCERSSSHRVNTGQELSRTSAERRNWGGEWGGDRHESVLVGGGGGFLAGLIVGIRRDSFVDANSDDGIMVVASSDLSQ